VLPARRRDGAADLEPPPRPVADRERPADVDIRPPARRLTGTSTPRRRGRRRRRRTFIVSSSELDLGWVHPRVGLDWVGSQIYNFCELGCVGLSFDKSDFCVNWC